MWRPPDPSNSAWRSVEDYEKYWTAFDERFKFRPGIDPAKWPGIREPSPSTTFDLGPIYAAGPEGFAAGESRVNDAMLAAMVEAFTPERPLIALDWQHSSYLVWPHEIAANGGTWWIPPFPNGDYYIFLTEEMGDGIFGHPWERTLCVFGDGLLPAVAPRLDWLPIRRERNSNTENQS